MSNDVFDKKRPGDGNALKSDKLLAEGGRRPSKSSVVQTQPILPVATNVELRLLHAGDADELHALIVKNLDRLKPWFDWVHDDYSPGETAEFLRLCEERLQARADFSYGIRRGSELIGVTGLHKIDWGNRIARIGYWLDRDATGDGIVTKSVRVLVRYAFEELLLHRIEIRCAPDNAASRAVPERLGFDMEGEHRDVLRLRDRYQSLKMYALLR